MYTYVTAPLAVTFPDLTAASPLADICVAAHLAGARAGRSDAAAHAAVVASDVACVAFLADPGTRGALEDWLGAYAADEAVLAGLSDVAPTVRDGLAAAAYSPRAEVLAAAWSSYSTAVYQARVSVSAQECTLSGGGNDYCRDCRGCSSCLTLIALEDAQIDLYLAAGETIIVSALRPVRDDEDSEPRSRGRVAVRRRVAA